ncbi:hypothetical protein K438DRAFT_2097506 [Mycena galopus ATCC 62051]|nr:hypothetical protein K438DRAFT_2097506 [Mycena galopus ATCC 62051]
MAVGWYKCVRILLCGYCIYTVRARIRVMVNDSYILIPGHIRAGDVPTVSVPTKLTLAVLPEIPIYGIFIIRQKPKIQPKYHPEHFGYCTISFNSGIWRFVGKLKGLVQVRIERNGTVWFPSRRSWRAGTAAVTVKARADTLCHPAVAGKQLNIVNGQYQLGYPAGAYFPNVPVEAEALTIPLAPVFNVDPSGNGLLTSESYILSDDSHTEFLNSFANAPAGSILYPTINSNLTQVLLESRITTFPGNT